MMRDERAPKTSRPRTDVPVAGRRRVSMREIRAVYRRLTAYATGRPFRAAYRRLTAYATGKVCHWAVGLQHRLRCRADCGSPATGRRGVWK